MKKLLIISLYIIGSLGRLYAQTLTQTVEGKVLDQATREGLFGVTILLVGSDPIIGTISGIDGTFILNDVPVGRQSFEFRMIGYQSNLVSEILVTSGKEVVLEIIMEESTTSLDEIVVEYQAEKGSAINEMATVSSRQFTVEETQRYAGGINDPARLVSSFAGVASPSVSSNGISIRGNSPSGLLWRIEGVEVPSPNHFADLSIAGAGALTILSSQMMGNSDFYTGAFPSEFGNATSGVFDINLRSGNTSHREHTLQLGVLGLDFATEGPINKEKQSSYLLNYRYSTMALISPLLPSDAGVLKYQDFSFKSKLPTDNAGSFTLWGIGALDGIDTKALESAEWESKSDRENSQTAMHMFASGINHQYHLGTRAFLNSSIALSGNGLSFAEQYLDDTLDAHPQSDIRKEHYKLTLQSSLTSYWGERHYNKTGFYFNNLSYDLAISDAGSTTSVPKNIVNEEGRSFLYQFYTQSQFDLSSRLTLNAGFHSQFFQLNQDLTLEPRVSFEYQLSPSSDLTIAYGLHSKVEPISLYFIRDEFGSQPNKQLSLMKSHHLVLSYHIMLSDLIRFNIEPYYQHLVDVPVAAEGYISTLNTQNNLFFNQALVSNGTGRNIGIDFTVERYLSKGFYFLLTNSIFDSKYTANDGVERNTRLNKNYVMNAVVGKEWQVGRERNNIFSTNLRLNYLGGNRIESIDHIQSAIAQEVIYGETGIERSFERKHKGTPIYSFTLAYRKNKPRYSSVWSLQVLNATQTEEFDVDVFNLTTQKVEQKYTGIMIPNLSYKIEF